MSDLERRIIARLTQTGQGIPLKNIQRDFRDVDPKTLSDSIRTLMETRRANIHQVDGERFLFLVNNLAEGQAVIFDIIRASGCEGIDQTALCAKAKLSKSEVTKAVGQLLAQQRIKDIRCFTNKAKKLYMLTELEPSEAVTGGSFYNDMRDIDVAFVDSIRSRVIAILFQRKVASISQLDQLVSEGGARTVTLKELRHLVGTLEMDGLIECVSDGNRDSQLFQLVSGGNVTRHAYPSTVGSLVSQFPCVGCPLIDRCVAHGVGAVTPATCTYIDDWIRIQS